MRRIAVAILHDDDLAADAVQETFVRLWHKRWRLGLMKEPQGFCVRTLRNLCVDMQRRNKLKQNKADAIASEIYIQQNDDDSDHAEQRYKQVEQAIATLPQQQQQLIDMKYVKQLTIHEIAQQTGLTETNITTQLSRAYAAIRRRINVENEYLK